MASVFKDGPKNKHKKYIHLAADCEICEFNELNVQFERERCTVRG